MTARIGRALARQQTAAAQINREITALQRNPNRFVEVPFEWHVKQTRSAVCFTSYGWVPRSSLAWRRADGTVVAWSLGRENDSLLISAEYAPAEARP